MQNLHLLTFSVNPARVNFPITMSKCFRCSSKVLEYTRISSTYAKTKLSLPSLNAYLNALMKAGKEFLNPYGTLLY
jgi:hypothetical protein